MAAPFFRAINTGALIHVRVLPNAGADRIEGVEMRDDGSAVLKLRVRAAPEGGKANAAAIALLAGALDVPKSRLAVTAGATARHKTIAVAGDPAILAPRLEGLAA
jgi:uncharacterized protein YggU (UPF0235/DUF167 family)